MITRRAVAVLAAMSLAAGLMVVVAPPAGAAATLTVQVGAFLGGPDGKVPGDGYRFYAPALKVMQGDIVTFDFQGFHTATFAPANADIQSWASANAGPMGKPFSFVAEDADDSPLDAGSGPGKPSIKLNNAAGFGDPSCGPVATPCAYDGSAVVNSGIPFDGSPWSAQINANAGDTVWFLCLVHPHMRQKITVVTDPGMVTTQPQIDAARDQQVGLDTDTAAAMHNKLKRGQSSHTTAGGKKVIDAFAGWDNHWLTLLAMYPKKLKIKKGQTVRWHFADNIYEDHTVSFPKSQALTIFEGDFFPSCDPDGDGGAGPDNPPDIEGPPFCTDPAQLEFDISPQTAWEQGNGTFKGNDFENSGVRGASIAETNAPWDLKFSKTSSKKGFKYFCMIHGPFMGGKVVVKR